jgi:hypothetical protein
VTPWRGAFRQDHVTPRADFDFFVQPWSLPGLGETPVRRKTKGREIAGRGPDMLCVSAANGKAETAARACG